MNQNNSRNERFDLKSRETRRGGGSWLYDLVRPSFIARNLIRISLDKFSQTVRVKTLK